MKPESCLADTALIVMAKAPRPGLAKTRLIPALGPAAAAALAGQLLRHTARQAATAGLAAVELCVSPDPDDPVFVDLAEHYGFARRRQVAGDLGLRMHAAFMAQLRHQSRVLMIGTDAPAIQANDLRDAAHALATTPAVFMPAEDGGYALIGLRDDAPVSLFHDMPWSTDAVMRITRERLRALGWPWTELRTVADIDEPADLAHLPADFRREATPLWPPTAAQPNPPATRTTPKSGPH